MPGCPGSIETPCAIMIRTATVPSRPAHSAITSSTAGSVGSTGLTSPKRSGCLAWTSTA